MDVATITMTREEAAEKLKAYESAIRRSSDRELAAAAEGYRHLAKGTILLDLEDVMRNAPRDELGRPRLAIARADRPQVCFSWRAAETTAVFSTAAEAQSKRWGWGPGSEYPGLIESVDFREPHTCTSRVNEHRAEGHLIGWALVPLVPPTVLKQRSLLRRRHVLFEVEQWANTPLKAQPDRDPYLLERLGGDLWAVVGEWDLTPLEMAITRGRQTS